MLDRAQYVSLCVALECVSSTLISIIFSEAGKAALLRRITHLANRFILRTFGLSRNPLVDKLTSLERFAKDRKFRVQSVAA